MSGARGHKGSGLATHCLPGPRTVFHLKYVAILLSIIMLGCLVVPSFVLPFFQSSTTEKGGGLKKILAIEDKRDTEPGEPVTDVLPQRRDNEMLFTRTQNDSMQTPAKVPTTQIISNTANNEEDKWMQNMKAVQSKRLEHKHTICKNSFGALSKYSLSSRRGFEHAYSNDDFKFLVTTVWKIGSQHWKKVFRILHDNGSVEFRKRQPDPLQTMNKMADFSKKIAKYYKVIFVRHPFARLVSAYRDKVLGANIPFYKDKNRKMLRVVRKNPTAKGIQDANVTFVEFLSFLTKGGYTSDPHWTPINLIYPVCNLPYDFIGKLETVGDDTTYLFKLLKVDKLVSYKSAYNHTGSGDDSLLRKFYGNIHNDIISKLTKLYDADFRVFGYKKPQNNNDFVDADLQGFI